MNTKPVDLHVVNLGSDTICDCEHRQPPSADEHCQSPSADVASETQQGTLSCYTNTSYGVSQQSSAKFRHAGKPDSCGVLTLSCSLPSEPPPQKRARPSRHVVNYAVDVDVCGVDATAQDGVDVEGVDATAQDGFAKTAADDNNKDVEEAAVLITEVLKTTTGTTSFILDIDLDFFSTTDPFLSTFTEQQRQLMSKLYRFTPPVDTSNEVCFKRILSRLVCHEVCVQS